jgi:CRP/FNR family transcriptional regulator
MPIAIEFLRSIPYFSGLGPEIVEETRKRIFDRKFRAGEIILMEGEPAEALFFIASGAVKVFKTSAEGKEQILSIVRPGESFNDISVFDEGMNPASAQAMGEVFLHGIAREGVHDLLKKHPEVAVNVVRVMAQRVRELVSLVEDLSFRHVISRVAKILLEYASDRSDPRPRLTQQEIAAMAGTAREVVGRSLKSLEESGVIRLESHRVVISNKDALRQMVAEPV